MSALEATDDPVADLAAAGAVYAVAARSSPDLYGLMFDGSLPLPDPEAADATLQHLVAAVERAVEAGRFEASTDAATFAHELWMLGHGACMLLVTGVLPFDRVEPVVTSGLVDLYRAAGDERARGSLDRGWGRGLGSVT